MDLRDTLSSDALITLAERESGGYGSGGQGLRKRIAAKIDWINARGPYTPDQVSAMGRQIQRLLVNRLRIALDRERYPAITDEKIDRPIFIIGFARSGTTFLHSLLAEHPDVLAPRTWHSHAPSPPPGAGPIGAARIMLAQRAVEDWICFCPTQLMMHPYLDKGAYQLIEDEEFFALDMHVLYPYHFYKVPTLDMKSWSLEDPITAYRFHKEMLQHFQWNGETYRWVCKGIMAPNYLDTLFQVYPDAICVWPHRPIEEIYASTMALSSLIYDTVNGWPNDWIASSEEVAEGMKESLRHLMASSLIDDPRIVHLSFREFSDEPVAAVRKIVERAGLPFSPEYASRLRAWLADPRNELQRYGRYPYSYESIGLSRERIKEMFSEYSERFRLNL